MRLQLHVRNASTQHPASSIVSKEEIMQDAEESEGHYPCDDPGPPWPRPSPETGEEYLESGADRGGKNEMIEYTVILEPGPNNIGAWVPDLPGCVSTGATFEEAAVNIREAIQFHIEGMREDSVTVPAPSSRVLLVKVA